MSKTPNEATQKTLNKQPAPPAPQQNANNLPSGRSSQLDPQAPAFVPGGTSLATATVPAPRRHSEPSSKSARAGKHGSRSGRGQAGREGGLSKALRSDDQADRSLSTDVSSRPAIVPPQHCPQANVLISPMGRSPSSRTVLQANHLLNFRLPSPGHQGRGGRDGRGRGFGTVRAQPFNRNQFLQANFRFLVSDAADLRKHAVDADLMLDWEDVVEVEMPVTAPVQCPISLETPPQCPQITPCGHIFGFAPMMAHLLSHGGPALRKASPCPLCFAPVAARELRLLRTQHVERPEVGEVLSFQLLSRHRASVVPVSAGSEAASHSGSNRRWPHISPEALARLRDGNGDASSVPYERHAKFTLIGDPLPLWVRTVEQLANTAVQVTSEGGTDALMEAPALYAAIDAIAARSAAWAERRQRQVSQQPGLSDGGAVAPEDAGLQAAAAVKRAAEQAAEAASASRQRVQLDAQRDHEFPQLPQPTAVAHKQESLPLTKQASITSAADGHPIVSPRTASLYHRHASLEDHMQAAFSDEDASPQHAWDESHMDVQHLVEAASPPLAPSSELLGSSPPNIAPVQQGTEFLFYQAADGQSAFLSPFDLRVLAAAYGSLQACPHTLSAPVLGLEHVVQTDATRKRFKHLAHIPLTGTFMLVEIDVSSTVSSEALEPFAKELAARKQRREDRAVQEAARRLQEAEAEAALASSFAAPSAAQLQAMPRPGAKHSDDDEMAAALERSLADVASSPSPPPPQHGISFANMTRMGFAASGSEAPAPPSWGPSASSTPLTPQGKWGKSDASAPHKTAAAFLQRQQQVQQVPKAEPAQQQTAGSKGRKQMVLLSSMQRRY